MSLRQILGRLTYRSSDGRVENLPLYGARIAVLSLLNWFELALVTFLFWTPLRFVVIPKYRQQMTPAQLCFLCSCLKDCRDVPGNVVEIGCAEGGTTLFLSYFLRDLQLSKPYFAIDTFNGFTKKDVAWETEHRGKRKGMYIAFRNNSLRRFNSMLRLNQLLDVRAIRADVNKFDVRQLGPISFALLDVDLYRPTIKALDELYDVLSPNGMIVVDDCDDQNFYWDGAAQAYLEFIRKKGFRKRIHHQKLGVLVKSDDSAIVNGAAASLEAPMPRSDTLKGG